MLKLLESAASNLLSRPFELFFFLIAPHDFHIVGFPVLLCITYICCQGPSLQLNCNNSLATRLAVRKTFGSGGKQQITNSLFILEVEVFSDPAQSG